MYFALFSEKSTIGYRLDVEVSSRLIVREYNLEMRHNQEITMADLMTTAVAMKQTEFFGQISLSALKMKMEAEQKIAQMLMENARLIAEASNQAEARGGIDIFV